MSKIPAILSATLTVSLVACGGSGGSDLTPIGQPVTTPLVTSEAVTTGSMTLYNSTDGLFITATAAPGWELRETRLSVTTSMDSLPHSKSGRANIDRFMLRRKGGPGTTELSYNLRLLVEPGTQLFIALYAQVKPMSNEIRDDHHIDCDNEGVTCAWALGTAFPGNDGSMYLTYVIRAAAPPTLAGKYLTYSQASWGAAPGANAATTYLAANYSATFPTGASIGDVGMNAAQFTTATAVGNFLPQSGTPAALLRRYVNPPDLANPFAGETLALTLNIGFDAHDPAFSTGEVPLSSMVVADPASPFYGLTVADVLVNANMLLSGRTDSMFTMADTFDAVSRINANFENGTADLGFLALP
jgi:hypothetical protein